MSDSDERPTRPMSPAELQLMGSHNWAVAVAALEQLGPWATYAFRLGLLALLQETVKDMTVEDAAGDTVTRARRLIESLAHLPWG